MNLGYVPVIPWREVATTLVSLLILSDYTFTRGSRKEEVKSVIRETQQYYNPARNSHYTFKVITESHQFYVDEENSSTFLVGEWVDIYPSWLFQEINSFQIQNGEHKRVGSFRSLTGLVVPLVVIAIMVLSMKYGAKLFILSFVSQLVLLGDLIVLLQ